MRSSLSVAIALAMTCVAAATASAQWTENFDSYANGSALHGQGGWTGWNGNPSTTSYVFAGIARSAPNADAQVSNADMVRQIAGVNSGAWVFTAWCYIPAGIGGRDYVTLYNTYYPSDLSSRSTDLVLDMFDNVVKDNLNPTSPQVPLVRDQWAQIRVEFDFELDWQRVFYNGTLLHEESWSGGSAPGGALRLQALGLYSAGAPTIFYDDIQLRQGGPTAVDGRSWGRIKASYR